MTPPCAVGGRECMVTDADGLSNRRIAPAIVSRCCGRYSPPYPRRCLRLLTRELRECGRQDVGLHELVG